MRNCGHSGGRGFALDPEGRVTVSVYSSGGLGRFVPQTTVGVIRSICGRTPAAI